MESSFTFVDELLDFSSDIGEEDDEEDGHKKVLPYNLNPNGRPCDSNEPSRLFPDLVEEELEWLSNEDVFPAVETFVDILSANQPYTTNSKHHSPVSVLDDSSIGTNSTTTTLMSCCGSVKVPVKARSKQPRRRRSGMNTSELQFIQSINYKNADKVEQKMKIGIIGRKCQHCGAEKTPQWRAGPLGPKTLCNACGVRYKSGRLVPEYRPASSPTFSVELHSNSHRKVMEMRRQKGVGMVVNNKAMDRG